MRVVAEIDVGGVDGYRSVTLVKLVSQTETGSTWLRLYMHVSSASKSTP